MKKHSLFILLSAALAFGMPRASAQTTGPRSSHYDFAVRTNLLYDAFLVPTLGVEWRMNYCWSVKLDGSFSDWGDPTGDVQKGWMISPEVRRYMGSDKRFYVGVGGNYAEYNIYGGMIGNMFPDNTGYQGSLWNAGVTIGYQLPLCKALSLDFNIGVGYTNLKYDSFTLVQTEIRVPGDDFPRIDNVRVYKCKDNTQNFWGPTQAGVSLVWTIGGNK